MKKNFYLVLAIVFSTQATIGQVGAKVSAKLREVNNDTVKYVKGSIIGEREKYIGKPLEILIKDFPQKIESYNHFMTNKPDVFSATYFKFYTYRDIENRKANRINPLIIVVTWKKELTTKELENAMLKLGGDKWNEKDYSFLKDRIIEKVDIVKYDY